MQNTDTHKVVLPTGDISGKATAPAFARIEAARQLLEDSRENLEEIASACGFSSAELMRRAFLRSVGITPSEYRERFRSARNASLQSPGQFSALTAEAGKAA